MSKMDGLHLHCAPRRPAWAVLALMQDDRQCVSPHDTPGTPDETRYVATRTTVVRETDSNNTQLTRPNEEESEPTLIQPVAKRCRRQLDTLRGQLADAMPVEIAEVRIVNIDGSITLRALATDWEGALIAIGASDRLGSDIHRLRPVSLGD
jgi:hypothetical protein